MQIAPLQTYQGPALDPAGSFLEGQQGALQRQAMKMKQSEFDRQQQERDQAKGILSGLGDNPDLEAAALKMLPVNPEMANTLLGMEKNRQQSALNAQDAEMNAVKIAQERIKQRKEQIALETKMASGAARALDGVEEPAQKQRIYSLYLKSVEDQGVNIPDELKGGWSPENEQNLKDIAELGQMMLSMDPSDQTSEIKNYEYSKSNPDFEDFYKTAHKGSQSPEMQAWEKFHAEKPDVPYSTFMSQYRKGIAGAEVTDTGDIAPIPGAPEAAGAMKAAEKQGEETGKAQGEAINRYEDLIAALPGLEKTAADLYVLADEATYTLAGEAKNSFVRQWGFDPGDRAAAKAKYENIVKTSVLPDLKATFGGNMSIEEGKWLLSTMGDPNLSGPEKKAQIDAWIEGKIKDIQKSARRVGKEAPKDMFQNQSRDIENLPDEDLDAEEKKLMEMLKNAN